jgi:hypothetical protein
MESNVPEKRNNDPMSFDTGEERSLSGFFLRFHLVLTDQ